MKGSRYHGGYNKVHPQWETKHTCTHCGLELIANGINWHNDSCAWKGIDMDKVYDALKNNMSVKKVMDTFGTSLYTTTQLKKGLYPNYPKIDCDGRKGHMNYRPKKEPIKPKEKKVYYDSNDVWELLHRNLDIQEIYRILDQRKNKKRKYYKNYG